MSRLWIIYRGQKLTWSSRQIVIFGLTSLSDNFLCDAIYDDHVIGWLLSVSALHRSIFNSQSVSGQNLGHVKLTDLFYHNFYYKWLIMFSLSVSSLLLAYFILKAPAIWIFSFHPLFKIVSLAKLSKVEFLFLFRMCSFHSCDRQELKISFTF